MPESNGWPENKKLVLSSIDKIENNMESLESCVNQKIKDLDDQHHACKEKTGIEIATLKTKAGILTAIISIGISLIVSVSATLISYSIINQNKGKVSENINSSDDKIESLIEKEIEERLKNEK